MESVLKVTSNKHGCDVFLDVDNALLFLPTFFCLHMNRTGQGFSCHDYVDEKGVAQKRFELEWLSDRSRLIYNNRLHQFLNWLSQYDKKNNTDLLAKHNNLPAAFLNKEYIDNHLIIDSGAGKSAIAAHLSALQYYYNYLCSAQLSTYKHINYSPKLKLTVEGNTKARTSLKYLSKTLRLYIYEDSKSLRDEILLRNGGELGLRTKENLGLLLNNFEFGGKKESGLKTLWREMATNNNQSVYRYLLQGKYSKGARGRGGKSREIFISRYLLKLYQKYYAEERPPTSNNTLLVNNAENALGTPIKENKGTDVFAELRKIIIEKQASDISASDIQTLEEDHTYHCLRHSFATDKFEEFCNEDSIRVEEASSDSRAFLRVARLMGHSIKAKTTATYIQLVLDKRMNEQGSA
jgi:integrase